MSSPLFSVSEINKLNVSHKISLNEMLKERYTPCVEPQVKHIATSIHKIKPLIMDGLITQMNTAPQSKQFWAKTIYFFSNVYEKGTPRKENDNHLYQVWAYTDFRVALLKELELDPKNFSFRLESHYCRTLDVGVCEYHNTLILVYRP
jgi:hypothetical protein